MAQAPLSYLSSQCIFQYLEAKQRISIAARCPSLRTVHKSSPLFIDQLVIRDTEYELNGIPHRFRIFFEPQNLTYRQTHRNSVGGIDYDVDEFGRWDGNGDLKKGDVQIAAARRVLNPEQEILDHLRDINNDRAIRGRRPCRFASVVDQEDVQHPSRVEILIPRPTYQSYVRCMMHVGSKQDWVRFSVGSKIRDVLRSQLANLLDNKHPVSVRNLNIDMKEGMLRLPTVNLRVRNLCTTSPVLESALSIVPSNFVSSSTSQKIAITFDNVKIQGFPINISVDTVIKLSTRPVHMSKVSLQPEDYQVLYQNWVNTPRPINTTFITEYPHTRDAKAVLRTFSEQIGVELRRVRIRSTSTRCMTTPIGEDMELNIYLKQDKNRYGMVAMEMMEKGAAVDN